MRRWLLTVTACLAAACAPEAEEQVAIARVPLTQYCDRFTAQACDAIAGCCGGSPGFDRTVCEDAVLSSCRGLVDHRVAAGGTFDEVAAAACLTTSASYLANCGAAHGGPWLTASDTYLVLREACSPVVRGSVPIGGTCGFRDECATREEPSTRVGCDRTPDGENWILTCTSTPRANIGQSCTTACVAGAHCDGGTCVADKPVGGSCTYDGDCVDGGCFGGVCTPPWAVYPEICGRFKRP